MNCFPAHTKNVWILLSLCALFVGLRATAQTVIHVPADVGTIQAAIDAAKNGDTVFVSPGIYNENLDFEGKAITVTTGAKSFADAAKIVVNGTTDGPVVNFATNEPASAVLNGFTLQGGHSNIKTIAGGILISNASPTVTNNVVQNNLGCGIFVNNLGSPLIQGNDIKGTSYSNDFGFQCGSATVVASEGTGVALVHAGTVQLIGNTIEENTQEEYGAIGTSSSGNGAGVYINGGVEVLLEDNIVRNNHGVSDQGLNTYAPSKLVLIQNLFYGNDFNYLTIVSDGQIYLEGASSAPYPSVTEVNNTIAGIGGGQTIGYQWASSTIANNLFIDTVSAVNPSTQPEYAGLYCGNTIFTNSNNDSFNEGLPVPSSCPSGAGLLFVDPQFVNPSSFDFHTQRTSPVVAAGDINAPMIPPTDLAGKNRTVCGTIDMGVYQVHPEPPIALTVTPNPAPGQSSVTLTAVLTGNCNIPTGLITFMDGATVLGTAMLNGAAVASFSTSFLFVGTHILTATYPGDFNFHGSTSNAITEVITGPPTTTTLSVSPNPALPLEPTTMSATVSSAYTVPAGTITFMAGGKALAPSVTVAANGSASATVSTLGAGTYSITAVYGGSTEYASSTSNTVLEVVNGAPTTTTLTSSLNPSSYGQTVTFTAAVAAPQSATTPTGVVSFMDGATVLGTGVLSASDVATFSTGALAVGNHGITAVYQGSTNDDKSTSNGVVQVVGLDATSIVLAASPNPSNFGQTVVLTANVIAQLSGTASPAGTVLFADQFGVLGSAPLIAGTATLSMSTLAIGTHNIVATYSAGGVYSTSRSGPVAEVIQPFDFTLNLSSTSLVLPSGDYHSLTATLSPVGGFRDAVVLSCSSLPANAQCVFQPSLTSLATGPQTVTLIVNTSQIFEFGNQASTHNSLQNKRFKDHPILLAFLLLPLLPLYKSRRKSLYYLSKSFALLIAIGGVAALFGIQGCGSGKLPLATPPGSYTITVVAVDPSTSLTHSADIHLVVH